MNTSLFAAPSVLASMQGLWRWFTATASHDSALLVDIDHHSSEINVNFVTDNSHRSAVDQCATGTVSSGKPVRIIRVLEASQAPAHAGRMVMSGRMADVCAELDRLAARETALH